jgi:hypothetical protein
MVTARDIEKARRDYVNAMGTPVAHLKRKRLEWLVYTAKLEQLERSP